MSGRRVLTYAWSCLFLMGLHAAEHPTASLGQAGNPATAASSRHPEGKFVSIGGRQIWIEIEGRGEPLLLVPGGPGYSHDYFHPFFSGLSNEHRIIYYDPFGTGKSERGARSSEYSLKQEIDEIELLRKALGIERWSIFGHSWGGTVAQGYAIEHSESVAHLIVADSPVSGAALQASNDRIAWIERELFPENWKRIQGLRSRGLVSSSPEIGNATPPIFGYVSLYKRESTDQPPPAPDAFNPDLSLAIMGNDMDFKLAGEAAKFDWRPGLRKLNTSVLVLNGRADLVITPRQAEEISSSVRGAKLRILEHSGHFCFSEESDETMREIGAFLKGK